MGLQLIFRRHFAGKSNRILILNPYKLNSKRNGRRNDHGEDLSPDYHQRILAEAAELDERLLQDELVSKVDKPFSPDLMNEQISAEKPNDSTISPQRYALLTESLNRGYTKKQLQQYLKNFQLVPLHNKKSSIIEKIINDYWKIKKDETLYGQDNFVENVIELNERDFVLALSHNGQLLREWTKRGAKISVFAPKRQIVVRSTVSTYNWILATLSRMENDIYVNVLELNYFNRVQTLTPAIRSLVQQMSNTYFKLSDDGRSITVYSHNKNDILKVRRLFTHFVDLSRWRSHHYYYDCNQENYPLCSFSEVNDTDAFSWTQRSTPWFRWEKIRKKNENISFGPYEVQESGHHYFSGDLAPKTTVSMEQFIHAKLCDSFKKAPQGAITLSASPGLLLHENFQGLPSSAAQRIFLTNTPHVPNVCGELPFWSDDLEISEDMSEFKPCDLPKSSGDDCPKSTDKTGFLNATSDLDEYDNNICSNTQYLQLRLIPSPYAAGEPPLCEEYPPIEIWCELPAFVSNRGVKVSAEGATVVVVPFEECHTVSLPSLNADIRFSVTSFRVLDISSRTRSYIESCVVNRTGPIWIPPTLNLEIDKQEVNYIYHSSSFVTQSNLKYKSQLLQFSLVEGGIYGGRQLMASHILHFARGHDDINESDVETFIGKALTFNKALELDKL